MPADTRGGRSREQEKQILIDDKSCPKPSFRYRLLLLVVREQPKVCAPVTSPRCGGNRMSTFLRASSFISNRATELVLSRQEETINELFALNKRLACLLLPRSSRSKIDVWSRRGVSRVSSCSFLMNKLLHASHSSRENIFQLAKQPKPISFRLCLFFER